MTYANNPFLHDSLADEFHFMSFGFMLCFDRYSVHYLSDISARLFPKVVAYQQIGVSYSFLHRSFFLVGSTTPAEMNAEVATGAKMDVEVPNLAIQPGVYWT